MENRLCNQSHFITYKEQLILSYIKAVISCLICIIIHRFIKDRSVYRKRARDESGAKE